MSPDRLFGVINIHKPRKMTSHDVVNRVRRIIGEKRVGHGGTLDPDATGVLPILVGKATKLSQFVLEMDKTYEAEMTLGVVTDTQDAGGEIVESFPDCSVDVQVLSATMERFVGTIMQTPPMVSAVKVGGKKLYELARAGLTAEREARPVRIDSLIIKNIDDAPGGTLRYGSRVRFEVTCSKGTYVRTLCHDLGQSLGCGAHMSDLKRLRVGPFTIETAVDLTDLEACHQAGTIAEVLLPPEIVLADLARVLVSQEEAHRLKHGQAIVAGRDRIDGSISDQGQCGVIDKTSRQLVCIARFDQSSERLRPIRVF